MRVELWAELADQEEQAVFERSFSVVKVAHEDAAESMAQALSEAVQVAAAKSAPQ